jgi:methylmalonyl-CoA mutase N-terminal domain/subunit
VSTARDDQKIDWSREFVPASLTEWQERVAKELRGKDPASLARQQEDGFALTPLQTASDTAHLPHLASGADALLRARGPGGSTVRQRIVGPSPEAAARQIERGIEDGAGEIEIFFDSIRVRRGEPFEPEAGDEERGDVESAADVALADLPADVFDGDGTLPEPRGLLVARLDDLRTALAPATVADGAAPVLALRAGPPATPAIVSGLYAIDPKLLNRLEAGYDPVGFAARGELEGTPFDAHWDEAADLVAFLQQHSSADGDARALALDGQPFHLAGATLAQEIAALACGGLLTLRRLDRAEATTPATLDPRRGRAAHLTFRLPLTKPSPSSRPRKLRALRLLWSAPPRDLTGLDPSDPRARAKASSERRARGPGLRRSICGPTSCAPRSRRSAASPADATPSASSPTRSMPRLCTRKTTTRREGRSICCAKKQHSAASSTRSAAATPSSG